MLGFFKMLFGGKNSEKVIDIADNAIFSKQEKAKLLAEMYRQDDGASLTRRWMAIMFAGTFLFIVLLACVAQPFDPDYAAFLFDVLERVLAQPITWILGFYFAKHLVQSGLGILGGKK